MPELPEVETTVQFLRERTVGLKIERIKVRWARTVHCPQPKEFASFPVSSVISAVTRRGKFIVMKLEAGEAVPARYLLTHLRMSGSLDVVSNESRPSKHDRVIISLSGGKEIRFHDPRKFGRMYLVNDPLSVTAKLGPEPLEADFKWSDLSRLLTSRRTGVKTLLLDQASIAGIGNIYADEALWRAGIHPESRTYKLKTKEIQALYRSIRRVLREAILSKGTDNGDGVVEWGLYEPRVYGRAGQPCRRCKTLIRRTVLGQRGTAYCPRCQKRAR